MIVKQLTPTNIAHSPSHEEVKCVFCKRKFWRYTKNRGGRRITPLRPSNCITCSSRCSKEYTYRNSKKNGR